MFRNVILAIVVTLTFVGCTKVHNIRYDIKQSRIGPMSTVNSLCIEIEDFVDKRPDINKNKIGYAHSPITGREALTFVASSPVDQIVKNAFSAAFQENGHRIDCANDVDISLSGTINTFFLEQVPRFFTVIVNATVDLDIEVIDAKTGSVLFARPYQAASSNEFYTATSRKNRESIINSALEEIVRTLSGDQELINKLNAL